MIYQIDLLGIAQGPAIIIIGLLGLLLYVAIQFRNPLAVIMWALSVIALLISGLYNFQDGLFWIGVMITCMIVMVGVVGRLSQL